MRARTLTAVALTALALAGCGKDKPAPAAPSTTPIEVTRAQAYKAAEQSIRTWQEVDSTNPKTLKGTKAEPVTTDSFRTQIAKDAAAVTADGSKLVGASRLKTVAPIGFAISPAPRTTMQICQASSTRIIAPDGTDVTVNPDGTPAPKGERTAVGTVALVPSLTGNGTWLIDDIQWEAKPC